MAVMDFSWFAIFGERYRRPDRGQPTLLGPLEEPSLARSIASLMEKHVLGGEIEYRERGKIERLKFKPMEGGKMSISATSFLIKSLAGLDIYLSSVANEGDVIIIDEPEMNAHPDAQLAITELLAMLVNGGIGVILTTHSPYMTDHINNLVEAGKLPVAKQEIVAEKLELKSRGAMLRREDVEIYHFDRNGKVTSTFDADMQVFDLASFGDTSDRLRNLYSGILAQGREG